MRNWLLFIVKTNIEKYFINLQLNVCKNELRLREIS